MRIGPLYHWSPRDRKKQIIRHGLRPSQRVTTNSGEEGYRAAHVCLSPSPAVAWSLSGGTGWTGIEQWDLWQVELGQMDMVDVQQSWGGNITEVRVRNRIPKSRLWWVGERITA